MNAAVEVELAKLRRSRVVLVASLAVLLGPCLIAALMLASASGGTGDPLSRKAGAVITGEGWSGYLDAAGQVFATGGLIGMGVVVAWCFGREFADRTVVSLYACAVPRSRVAAAKLAVILGWTGLLALATGPVLLLVGLLSGLGAPDRADLAAGGRVVLLVALTGLLASTVALFASAGRGYLPAIGALVGAVVLAQVAVVAGFGGWLPWSVPGLWVVAAPATGLDPLPGWRLLLVPLCAAAFAAATIRWWRRAELA